MVELVISIVLLAFCAGAILLFHRSSKKSVPSEDGGRGFRDASLAEGRALQNRNDGLDIQ